MRWEGKGEEGGINGATCFLARLSADLGFCPLPPRTFSVAFLPSQGQLELKDASRVGGCENVHFGILFVRGVY